MFQSMGNNKIGPGEHVCEVGATGRQVLGMLYSTPFMVG